jgi:hypothetical protein
MKLCEKLGFDEAFKSFKQRIKELYETVWKDDFEELNKSGFDYN